MKYQAPVGVTAIFCAGVEISPDENGGFEAAEFMAVELEAHGCVVVVEIAAAAEQRAEGWPRTARAGAEKAN